MPVPPQHLLGGLNVAILVTRGSDLGHVDATKFSLEEQGINVLLMAPGRNAVEGVAADGSAQTIAVSQRIPGADPDAFDAVVVIADQGGAKRLSTNPDVAGFIARLEAEHKPIGVLSPGAFPDLIEGFPARSEPAGTEPAPTRAAVAVAGGVEGDAPLAEGDANGMERFTTKLKELLAQRRRATMTLDNDTPSAVGEDG